MHPMAAAATTKNANSRSGAGPLLWKTLAIAAVCFMAWLWKWNFKVVGTLGASFTKNVVAPQQLTPWDRIEDEYRAYLKAAGYSADDFNDPSFKRADAFNSFNAFKQQQLQQQQKQQQQQQAPQEQLQQQQQQEQQQTAKTLKDGIPPLLLSPPSVEREASSTRGTKKYQIVFSTGCTPYQDWQSYTLFYHAMTSGQPGNVTRVASGCDEESAKVLREQHSTHIQKTMSSNFHLHLTPEYSYLAGKKKYKFFNKPFGLRHWMEQSLGFPNSRAHEDDIVIILDPDQFILRPFTWDYRKEKEMWVEPIKHETVSSKKPIAQLYGFGGTWIRQIDWDYILNYTQTHNVSHPDAYRNNNGKRNPDYFKAAWTVRNVAQYYSVGPPYLAVGRDMYQIVKTWSDFVVPIYHLTDGAFLAEMFAYSAAAFYQGLPHQLVKSFMVSNVGMHNAEGWKSVDQYSLDDICSAANHEGASLSQNDSIQFPSGSLGQVRDALPHVMHYCQRYFIGPWYFGKYRLSKDFLSCAHPLLKLPSENWQFLSENHLTTTTRDFNVLNMTNQPVQRRLNTMALCFLLPALNRVSLHHKRNFCDDSSPNYSRSYVFPYDKKKKK